MSTTKRMPADELRRQLGLAVEILQEQRDSALREAEESKARSTDPLDFAAQDARCLRYKASGFQLALHAMAITTRGEFGEEMPDDVDEVPAATS